MMTDIDDFLTKVLPYAPGCPEPVAREHIRNAAIEFCEETKLWRFDDAFDVGDDPNIVCAPQGAVIHQIERCDFNGCKLEPRGVDWLDEHMPDWRSDEHAAEGQPLYFTQVCPDTIQVVPRAPGRVKVWLRLKPAEDADQLPSFLAAQHKSVIGWGALANILMLPGQPFTSLDAAALFRMRFDRALGRASKLQSTGQQRAPIRTTPHYF